MPNSTQSPSSLSYKYSRYVQGGTTETNSIGLGWWERRAIPKDPTDVIYYVENQYEKRIDLISANFYGDGRFWWVIAQFNDILDPHSEIYAGRMLVLPTKSRLFTNLMINKV